MVSSIMPMYILNNQIKNNSFEIKNENYIKQEQKYHYQFSCGNNTTIKTNLSSSAYIII